MTRANPTYYQCPHCSHIMVNDSRGIWGPVSSDYQTHESRSGNYRIITKCSKCDTQFWLDDEYKTEPKEPQNDESSKFDSVYHLDLSEVVCVLEKGLCRTTNEEKILRLHYWQKMNRRSLGRVLESLFQADNEEIFYKSNLRRLIDIFEQKREQLLEDLKNVPKELEKVPDFDDELKKDWLDGSYVAINDEITDNLLMIAEMYRNLNDFESSKKYIAKIKDRESETITEGIENEIAKGNTLTYRTGGKIYP